MVFLSIHELKGWFVPGFLKPPVRAFYFILFLIITVLQAYYALLVEANVDEIEKKQPNVNMNNHQTIEFF